MDDDDDDQSEDGPDGFALDLDIKYLRISELWIHQDYIRLYDYCNTHYNNVWSYSEPGRPPPSAPSVVITGQPGIGEYFFLLFTIFHPRTPYKQGKAGGSFMPSGDA
jgi:hypothetical protein